MNLPFLPETSRKPKLTRKDEYSVICAKLRFTSHIIWVFWIPTRAAFNITAMISSQSLLLCESSRTSWSNTINSLFYDVRESASVLWLSRCAMHFTIFHFQGERKMKNAWRTWLYYMILWNLMVMVTVTLCSLSNDSNIRLWLSNWKYHYVLSKGFFTRFWSSFGWSIRIG